MRILFNREWTQAEIRKVVRDNCYLEFSDHKDLKALCVEPFADEEEYNTSDYSFFVFAVPSECLKEFAKRMFNINDLNKWLQIEYTTDESQAIFEEALNQRQVVMVDFD